MNQDNSLPESLPSDLPEHNLYDIGTYIHRNIVQTLYRFNHQVKKFDVYLNYLAKGTREQFRPKLFIPEAAFLVRSASDVCNRLDGCKERGNGSLTLVRNALIPTPTHPCNS
jgi:hypothetical protein